MHARHAPVSEIESEYCTQLLYNDNASSICAYQWRQSAKMNNVSGVEIQSSPAREFLIFDTLVPSSPSIFANIARAHRDDTLHCKELGMWVSTRAGMQDLAGAGARY
jgi:hypothetical protein